MASANNMQHGYIYMCSVHTQITQYVCRGEGEGGGGRGMPKRLNCVTRYMYKYISIYIYVYAVKLIMTL